MSFTLLIKQFSASFFLACPLSVASLARVLDALCLFPVVVVIVAIAALNDNLTVSILNFSPLPRALCPWSLRSLCSESALPIFRTLNKVFRLFLSLHCVQNAFGPKLYCNVNEVEEFFLFLIRFLGDNLWRDVFFFFVRDLLMYYV